MKAGEQQQGWSKHKSFVISGAQIAGILTLLAGLWGAYSNSSQNTAEIGKNKEDLTTNSQWMKDQIKTQNTDINALKVENAKLETEIQCLKENVRDDEHWERDLEHERNAPNNPK